MVSDLFLKVGAVVGGMNALLQILYVALGMMVASAMSNRFVPAAANFVVVVSPTARIPVAGRQWRETFWMLS